MPTIYVVDTSYLVELYGVPKHSSAKAKATVRAKFAGAIDSDARVFVPFSCIIELGNAIAWIKDGGVRSSLAECLKNDVINSIQSSIPWTITPPSTLNSFERIMNSWCDQYVVQNVGVSDTFVIEEATRLRNKHSGLGYRCHIWTKDRALKAREPDAEENPYIG